MISYSKPTELGGTAGRTRDQLCPARSPAQAQKVSQQQGNHVGQDERLFVGSSFGAAATAAVGEQLESYCSSAASGSAGR